MARRSVLEQSIQILDGRDWHLDGRADRSRAVSASLIRADGFQRHHPVPGIDFGDCCLCALDVAIGGPYPDFLVIVHPGPHSLVGLSAILDVLRSGPATRCSRPVL